MLRGAEWSWGCPVAPYGGPIVAYPPWIGDRVLVVTRHRVQSDPETFLGQARDALDALAARPGFVAGTVGRAADDSALWAVVTRWVHVGAYRRALSAYDVKVRAVPLLSTALDEPSAFEVLAELAGGAAVLPAPGGRSDLAADARSVGLGSAAGPAVPSDLPGHSR